MARKSGNYGSLVSSQRPVDLSGIADPIEAQQAEGVGTDSVDLDDVLGNGGPQHSAVTVKDNGDGSYEFGTGGDEATANTPNDFNANLAEHLPPGELAMMATDMEQMIAADEKSREPWAFFLAHGMELLGIGPATRKPPFPNASEINHPMIAEAMVQFGARAMQELLPPDGPVKSKVIGKQDDDIRDKAATVESYMNWQLTTEDKNYYEEAEQLFFILPLECSGFKKTYFDELLQITTSKLVRAVDLLIPYTASSIYDSPRLTHIMYKSHNEVVSLQRKGTYRDIDLQQPRSETQTTDYGKEVQVKIDQADNKMPSYADDDYRHTLYEMQLEYCLSIDDPDNEQAVLPYIATLDKASGQILRIRRNWKKDDAKKQARNWFTHYKYLPGLGVYGLGLIHVIGGFAQACTGSVRALLDSAAFATLQGGFKSKDARLKSEISIRPGEWVDVDLTAEELQKAFFTPPFKEPSQALFQLLELMQDNGRRFAGTVEAMVGDAPANGPVGTIVAIIEQASKVMSGIHRRLHRAQTREFELRMQINREYMPDAGVKFNTMEDEEHITLEDFDDRIILQPVSDPNITSAAQKIAIDQSIMQLAQQAPQLYRMAKIHHRLLTDMGVDDPDEYLIDPTKTPRMDPFSEYAMLIAGQPIRAFIDQNHKAHLAVHQAHLQLAIQSIQDPQQQQGIVNAFMEHMAKHEAYDAFNTQAQQAGQKMPPINLYALQDGTDPVDMPPEIEDKMSQMQAMFMTNYMKQAQAQSQASQVQKEVPRKTVLRLAQQQADQAAPKPLTPEQAQKMAAQQPGGGGSGTPLPPPQNGSQPQPPGTQQQQAPSPEQQKQMIEAVKAKQDMQLKSAAVAGDLKTKQAVAKAKAMTEAQKAQAEIKRKNDLAAAEIKRKDALAHSEIIKTHKDSKMKAALEEKKARNDHKLKAADMISNHEARQHTTKTNAQIAAAKALSDAAMSQQNMQANQEAAPAQAVQEDSGEEG